MREFPQKIARYFCLNDSAPRRLPAARPCVARFPHFWGPAPAAKYTYIDAFNGKTVTRETLLRYTFKSVPVNVLIRGNLWKTWPSGFDLLSRLERREARGMR
jgi:hypothetical protein